MNIKMSGLGLEPRRISATDLKSVSLTNSDNPTECLNVQDVSNYIIVS